MVIVFSSLEIETLQYIFYPPYGLITAAFMPVGSYLLFIGIFSSAQNISRNIEIRKDLIKTIQNLEYNRKTINKFKVSKNKYVL